MLPTLALVLLPRELDGEAAAAVARRFLVGMGVRDLKGLNALSSFGGRPGGQTGKTWSVGFDRKEGGWFSVELDAREVPTNACSSAFNADRLPVDPKKADAFARRLMARVPNAVPVRLDPSLSGPGMARFKAVVDGRVYFNLNPVYGYLIHYLRDGSLAWFGRDDAPPPPAARVPRVPRLAAEAKLTKAWLATKPVAWPHPRRVETELGYYVRKGEPKARLVWRGKVVTVDHGERNEFAGIKTFVDASTGATFEADD